jgi:hypothetical protein
MSGRLVNTGWTPSTATGASDCRRSRSLRPNSFTHDARSWGSLRPPRASALSGPHGLVPWGKKAGGVRGAATALPSAPTHSPTTQGRGGLSVHTRSWGSLRPHGHSPSPAPTGLSRGGRSRAERGAWRLPSPPAQLIHPRHKVVGVSPAPRAFTHDARAWGP